MEQEAHDLVLSHTLLRLPTGYKLRSDAYVCTFHLLGKETQTAVTEWQLWRKRASSEAPSFKLKSYALPMH